MTKTKIRMFNISYWLVLIGADLVIFFILGLLLMSYDDNYDSSKGEYWSLSSMNTTEKVIYLCYITWIVLNIIGVIFIGRKIYKRIKNSH